MGVRWGAIVVVVGVSALLAAPADAAFPGENGKISYVSVGQGWTVNPDGTAETPLPPATQSLVSPIRWSPDGTRYATSLNMGCGGGHCSSRIATFAADGTDQQFVGNHPEALSPSWSNDRKQLAYSVDGVGLLAINIDGTNNRQLLSGGLVAPAWSPDGARIVFESGGALRCFSFDNVEPCGISGASTPGGLVSWSPDGSRVAFTRNTADGRTDIHVHTRGGTTVRLTTDPSLDAGPAWSPDGTKIAFLSSRDDPTPTTCFPCVKAVYVMDADGSNPTRVSTIRNNLGGVDWQPLPVDTPTSFPARPKAATPLRVSLVQTFKQCTSPDSEHGPPLAFGSCGPPVAESGRIVTGATADLQAPNKSVGYMRFVIWRGDPAPPDDSDLRITFSLTNVMYASDFSDYLGELSPRLGIQTTDKEPSGVASTLVKFPLRYTVPCASTADATIGSTCASDTTVNALVPGAIADVRRAIWELDQVKVYDGGNDGIVATEPNLPFATQGVFVP